MLARQGYTLSKSRRRDPRAFDFGRYVIIDPQTNGIVAGVIAGQYGMDLDEAEEWALEGERPVQEWEEVGTVGANWVGLDQVASTEGDGPYPVKVLRDSDGTILSLQVDLSGDRSGT
jgi:hypothetical protein